MNDRLLSSYIMVVENGSFAQAAKAMFITPQALHQQIELLEAEMGFPLLTRNSRGVVPTPAGQLFYTGAKQLLDQTADLLLKARQMNRQTATIVRMCMSANYRDDYIIDIIKGPLKEKHPRVRIEMAFIMPSAQCFNSVLAGEVDATVFPDIPKVAQSGLCFVPGPQKPYECVCLLSRDNPLCERDGLYPEDLTRGDLFYYNAEFVKPLLEYIEDRVPDARPKQFAALSYCDQEYSSISDICFHGGIFLMPRAFASAFPFLTFVPLVFEMDVRYGLIYRPDPSPALEKFIEVYRWDD
ncbi:MAG: LysR family transcriptional regulator [Clostridia bacterium]|nr:LysR family transcriptional regulator [Clostridia bacterium]